jgi:3-hydroxyacyl-[acyl-carrier-protein] dehydratase
MAAKTPDMPLGIKEIQEYIPHRFPFLLVDRITEYTPGESIVAIKNVSFTDPYLQGHFPGHPVMPGVLQIEAMAQACAVYGRMMEPHTTTCLLTEVTESRFRRQVVPGDTMVIKVKVDKQRKSFYWFTGEIFVGDTLAATVKLSAKLD